MKIIDKHVTRIELSADEVDRATAAFGTAFYRTGVEFDGARDAGTPAPPREPVVPSPSNAEWKTLTETTRVPDGGAVVTITRTR